MRLFHTDATICGASAIAQRAISPIIFRHEAIDLYGVNTSQSRSKQENKIFMSKCIGSKSWSYSEKAVLANVAAVREFEANGINIGYNPI